LDVLERSSRRAVDVLIVGAGVVGCALARVLARGNKKVAVLERESAEGRGVTSRNSGVIHSGLFSRAGTRKAKSCIRGRELLYAWCEEKGVPHRKTGKLIVAWDDDELGALEGLAARALDSKISTELVRGARLAELEPPLAASSPLAALWLPDAGIVDAHALCRSYRVDAEAHGAFFATSATVDDIEIHPDRAIVRSTRGPLDAAVVVNAAGLDADRIASMTGLERPVHPCRGDYFRLVGGPAYQRLIYPAPPPGPSAGLGIHLTLELDGAVRMGPDAQWVLAKDDFRPAPEKHAAFLAATQRLLGVEIAADQLRYEGCGIRPKRHGPNEDAADFEILATERCIHLLGIESPGLTAAGALALEVASHLGVKSLA